MRSVLRLNSVMIFQYDGDDDNLIFRFMTRGVDVRVGYNGACTYIYKYIHMQMDNVNGVDKLYFIMKIFRKSLAPHSLRTNDAF